MPERTNLHPATTGTEHVVEMWVYQERAVQTVSGFPQGPVLFKGNAE